MKGLLIITFTIILNSCDQHKTENKRITIDTAFLKNMVDSISKVSFDSITQMVLKQPVDTNFIKACDLNSKQIARLVTCEICGYVALLPDSGYCFNCYNNIFDSTFQEISSKHNWLRNQQLYWFELDSQKEKVDFYFPKTDHGFKKDIRWRPIVTEKEVRDFSKRK